MEVKTHHKADQEDRIAGRGEHGLRFSPTKNNQQIGAGTHPRRPYACRMNKGF
jgi:hypothetical protein